MSQNVTKCKGMWMPIFYGMQQNKMYQNVGAIFLKCYRMQKQENEILGNDLQLI